MPAPSEGPNRTSARDPALIRALALTQKWCGSAWGGVVLVVLCLCVLVPGLWTLPPIDRDEARFAQASRQMLESRDLVVPMVQDRPRLNKPPLIYWLQSASVYVFTQQDVRHDAIWMYRVPGMCCMVLSVLLTWRLGCRMHDARVGWVAGAMLAVCPLVVFEAHQARADQLLTLTVVAAQYCMWRMLRLKPGTPRAFWMRIALGAAFWTCIAAGVLAKGFVTPMVAALTCVCIMLLRRDPVLLLRLRPLLGVLLVVVLVAPWVLAVARRVGWEHYWKTVVDEAVTRSLEAREGKGLPPGYYLITLVAFFFPGSLLTGVAVLTTLRKGLARGKAWWRPRWAGRDAELFLLAWVIPAWIVFEVAATKLPHYVMPLYPALAILTARTVLAHSSMMVKVMRGLGARVGFVLWGVVGVCLLGGALVAAGLLAQRMGEGDRFLHAGSVLAGVCIVLVLGATCFAIATRPLRALVLAGVACVLCYGALLGWMLPRTRSMWVAQQAVEAVGRINPRGDRPLGAIDFHEDSLIFLTRGRVQRLKSGDDDPPSRVAGAFMDEHLDGLLLLPREVWEPLASAREGWRELASPKGYNYSKGKRVDLVLVGRGGGL